TDQILFVENIPYEWILPKVYCALQHGGSGTVHMALKYGCSTMIIPHIIDQYVWNDKIFQLGAGPKGVGINKIHSKKLIPLIKDLWSNEAYKSRAIEISRQMQNEHLEDDLYNFLVSQ
ncbi:MAG TPA: glycosyltransferase, partial [Saprospiraceae bacterium]|nr:glycosyltransferase [Saprospiraceae bacterium]